MASLGRVQRAGFVVLLATALAGLLAIWSIGLGSASTQVVESREAHGDQSTVRELAPARRKPIESITDRPATVPLGDAITGQVLDGFGRPVPGAYVVWGDPARWDALESESRFLWYADMIQGAAKSKKPPFGATIVVTDPDGRFPVTAPPDKPPSRIAAWSPSSGVTLCSWPEFRRDNVIILVDRVRITGSVEEGNSAPIAVGAIVLRNASNPNPIRTLALDSGGKFSTPPLSAGDYVVQYRSPGYAPVSREVQVPESGSDVNVVLVSRRVAAPLDIILTSADGQPWVGPRLEIESNAALADLTWLVSATLRESSVEQRLAAHNGEYDSVSGRLRASEGPPLGCHVSLWRGAWRLATTKEIGPSDKEAVLQWAEMLPVATLEILVRFNPEPRSPIPCTVMVGELAVDGLHPVLSNEAKETLTRLPIPSSLAGRRYYLKVGADGYVTQLRNLILPKGGVSRCDVHLGSSHLSVSGALHHNNKPAAGVAVFVVSVTGDWVAAPEDSTTMTDEQGRFRLRGLLPGTLRVIARKGRLLGTSDVKLEQTSVSDMSITLSEGSVAEVRGKLPSQTQFRVLDSQGRILDDDRVRRMIRHSASHKVVLDPMAVTVEAYDSCGQLQALGQVEQSPGGPVVVVKGR